MAGGFGIDPCRRDERVSVMVVVIAAKDEFVPFLPILERVTRRPQTNHRFARIHVTFDHRKLVLRERHPPHEKNGEVRVLQRFEPRDMLVFAFQIHAFHGVVAFQKLLQGRERVRGRIFVLARNQDDRRFFCQLTKQRESGKQQKANCKSHDRNQRANIAKWK